ncbi:speckle-type POZ protein-like [Uloborus diversus]|uniref:speckle-type POZ protein-like n=1 Tax=Uloborus diversus TaxID=327109 RepID=UPI0024093D27|nr:speckle-type POZ protein-like [Uloborus diversus]
MQSSTILKYFSKEKEGADEKEIGSTKVMEEGSQDLKRLSKDFKRALENLRFTDVTLRVGDDEFPAHKMVLMSRSEVFERMFDSDMKENRENVVDLVDVNASSIKDMLFYMYTGKTEKLSVDRAMDLYVAADRYATSGLKEVCKKIILKLIDESSVCNVAVLADLYSDEKLREAVKLVLKKNPNNIFQSQKWRDFAKERPALYSELMESTMLDLSKERVLKPTYAPPPSSPNYEYSPVKRDFCDSDSDY